MDRPGRRWEVLAEELLGCISLMPLLSIDFRAGVSGMVSCSDASEEGAGVCVARSLSACGREALFRRLRPMGNLFGGRVGLWESFAGIGSGRRALDILWASTLASASPWSRRQRPAGCWQRGGRT